MATKQYTLTHRQRVTRTHTHTRQGSFSFIHLFHWFVDSFNETNGNCLLCKHDTYIWFALIFFIELSFITIHKNVHKMYICMYEVPRTLVDRCSFEPTLFNNWSYSVIQIHANVHVWIPTQPSMRVSIHVFWLPLLQFACTHTHRRKHSVT